jgi:hypothetical protein
MHRFWVIALLIACLLAAPLITAAQQMYRIPDKKALKHLTTKPSSHASGVPGEKTIMDYYEAPNGDIITIHTFRGRSVVFSVHSNKDIQGTYRLYMDMKGDGNFQEISRGSGWQIPAWAR